MNTPINSIALLQASIDKTNKEIESHDKRIAKLKEERQSLCIKALTLVEAIKTITNEVPF
jgi:peptidoglycan hydrolase CwlO-like protein